MTDARDGRDSDRMESSLRPGALGDVPALENPSAEARRRPVVYLFSPEDGAGRDTVAVGLLHTLAGAFDRPEVFQPIVGRHSTVLPHLMNALTLFRTGTMGNDPSPDEVRMRQGAGIDEIRHGFPRAQTRIVARLHEGEATRNADAILCVGSNRSAASDPYLLQDNARVAADLDSRVVICLNGADLSAPDIAQMVRSNTKFVEQAGSRVIGVFVSPCDPSVRREVLIRLVDDEVPIWFIPRPGDARGNGIPQESRHGGTADGAFDERHVHACLEAYLSGTDEKDVLEAIARAVPSTITPAGFQYSLIAQARRHRRTIILPEGDDDRILRAVDYLLRMETIDAVVVGERDHLLRHAGFLNLDALCQKATVVSQDDERLLDRMVPELVRLRSSHGIDAPQARELLRDPSYFGTMYVQLGLADGMVSGANHSTANTVRPALQIIKARPGVPLVSGAMVMCLPQRIDLYADVALLTNPDARQLATVALESAHTAQTLGIRPIVGLLSYSTGTSGKGPDVDLVREATQRVRDLDPTLAVTGPIQFDAAWDPSVAAMKAPGDPNAGRVNVFVLPDLSASNVAVKAVQRIGNAVAVGPILQGLRRPVNDLSRGASVRDIVNTIALTAVMAQDA